MQKLILAMVAVICLDVGFIAYTANDRLADAAWIETSQPVDNSLMTAGTIGEPEAIAVEDNISLASNRLKSYSRAPRPVVAEHRRFLRPRTEATLAPHTFALHKTIVITIPKTPPVTLTRTVARESSVARLVNAERSSTPVGRDSVRSDNRSFIASAVPILKKPYDWIKAFGSKLR